MKIIALQKTTLIDFPGKIACIVFLAGCNFRCPWCYSSEIVLPEKIKGLPEVLRQNFFDFLEQRKNKLEGVVVCGGEPTLNPDLPQFCYGVKKLGFSVKLDTNGSNPDVLQDLLVKGLVDYVALDIKTAKEKYPIATGGFVGIAEKVGQSAELLKKNGLDYEFRTTVVPGIVSKEDIFGLAKWVGPAKRYYLQAFRPEKTLNPVFSQLKPYSEQEMLEMKKIAAPFFDICELRGLD